MIPRGIVHLQKASFWRAHKSERESLASGCLVGKHQCLEFDVSVYQQPVQTDEERCDLRSLWLVEDHSHRSILDQLQRLDSSCSSHTPVLSWQERHPVWSSAAVAHLLQGSTYCAFRDGILHTLVVTSGYLSYCCLSIISNQSAHSPLTSDINKAHTTAAHWIFSLFRTILCKP